MELIHLYVCPCPLTCFRSNWETGKPDSAAHLLLHILYNCFQITHKGGREAHLIARKAGATL